MNGSHEPVPLRHALDAVGKELGLAAPNVLETVIDAWLATAGASLAEHARVRSLRDGVCTLEVDEPAFATRVRFLSAVFAEEVSRRCGRPVVDAVNVVVNRPRKAR